MPELITCRNGHTGTVTVFVTVDGHRQRVGQGQLDPVGCEACRVLLGMDATPDDDTGLE